MPGMPQMPGMPNMNPYGGYQQPQTPQYTAPSKKEEEQPFENPNSQKKFESVTEVKDKANKLFKANELDKACEKYFEAINNIRATECLKESPQGRRLEINCRINLALCKIKQEKYDEAIDQWERVLLAETLNLKALYRISVAYEAKGMKLEAWSYIKRAYNLDSNDSKISELYQKMKAFKDEKDKQKEDEQKRKKDEQNKKEEENKQKQTKAEKLQARKDFLKFSSSQNPEEEEEKKDKEEVIIEEEKVPERYLF